MIAVPVLVASLPKNEEEELRVSLVNEHGQHTVDLRIFARFTLARVLMPTKKAIAVNVEQIPDLIKALGDCLRAAERAAHD